jgi:GT2 family glycosyltransferase
MPLPQATGALTLGQGNVPAARCDEMERDPMRVVAVIPTLGRREQVARTVAFLAQQTRLPDEVVVSAPDPSHVALPANVPFPVRAVFGPTGLCAQRNTALSDLGARFDIVTFFDDDFVPAPDYIAGVVEAFTGNAEFAVVMGRVIRDGASNAGLDWPDALDALSRPDVDRPREAIVDHVGAYGCNMSIRVRAIGDMRFDERLVLYGWQEDIDFTSRLRARGRVVCVTALRGVHLGLKAGRVSGRRFGYSQVVNPVYLIRKRSVPAGFALRLMARNLAANVVHSVRPEPYVDRRGRLWGNLLGIAHVVRGRIEPEHALRL